MDKPYDTILSELLAVVEQLTTPTSIRCVHCGTIIPSCSCQHSTIRHLLSQLQAAKPPAPVIPLNDTCDLPPCDWMVHNPRKTLLNRKPLKIGREEP